METKSPRRTLFLGAPDSGVLPLIKDLTGSAPDPRPIPFGPSVPADSPTTTDAHENDSANASTEPATTTAGLTHVLSLKTRYYSAEIPIWIDEASSPNEWKSDFLSPEAREVVRAVGAWIVVFRKGAQLAGRSAQDGDQQDDGGHHIQEREEAKQLMQAVKEIIDYAHGEEEVWDGVCLAVGMPGSSWKNHGVANGTATDTNAAVEVNRQAKPLDIQGEEDDKAREQEEWEDDSLDLGFEYIDGSMGQDSGTNEFGERQGTARIIEALEANEWETAPGPDDEKDLSDMLEMGEFEIGKYEDIPSENEQDQRENVAHPVEHEGFNIETSQMEGEFASLKAAVRGMNVDSEDAIEDEAVKVEELEKMMLKMTAVRDMSAHMPEAQRKRLAAKTVNEVMKDL